MYPQGDYPHGDQDFAQLYQGGPEPQTDEDEAAAKRRAEAIVVANSGVAVSAAGGSAAAASVILAGQSAGAAGAGGAGAGGAAGGSLASGGAVVGMVKGGLGMKFLIGGIAGAVVVSGVVVGVAVINRDSVGNDAAPMQEAALDKGIEDFDFANTTFTDSGGNEYALEEGRYVPPDIPEGRDEGYHLTATEFADVDGDNDLDAATMLEWWPNAGGITYTANLWLWDGDKAVQVEYPVTTGYHGMLADLKAVEDGFEVTVTEPPPSPSTGEGVTETFTFGYKDGFPVQLKPLGSVDRCPEFDDYPRTGPYPDVIPKVAPDDKAPDVGKAEDFTAVYAVWTDRSAAYQGQWMIVQVEHTDGSTGCGWIPASTTG